jgi:ADP-heptose:LPS heptosyltransferase
MPADVIYSGSVLGAMCRVARCDLAKADFRLPVPADWRHKAQALIDKWRPTKPLLIYRPLMERSEWGGCRARNPDHDAYARLYESIRDRFFVISVADLVPKLEWLVGKPFSADVECHSGDLSFEVMAALFSMSAMVFCSPGFAVPLAQAVETPVVCVFGGYENSKSFSAGAVFSPYFGIDPIRPCQCWSHSHACRKEIDVPTAIKKLKAFADAATDGAKGIPEYSADQLERANQGLS